MFEELGNDRIDGTQNLSIQVNFNNLIYYFKAKSDTKKFIGFKGPLGLYKNIKNRYTTLENAGENQKKFTSDINKRIKRGKNIRGAQKCNKNIKSL